MKILFLTDNFPPESNAPATRTYDHCSKWVSLGYDVSVITCFPNFPTGKVYDGYKNKLYAKEETNGIKVIRVWSFITSNKGFVRRILDFSSFACSSFIYGLFVKTDIIVATSPQFFTAISVRYLSIFKNKPWVMEIRDLWPNSIAAVGSMSKNSLAFSVLKVIETRLYVSAKRLVVVTDSFKNYLISDHNIDSKKIGVFKNGIILDTVKNYFSNNTIKLKHDLDLDNKIIISYIGTHGLAHALTFILKATQRVENPNIHFLFIGDGAQKNRLVEYSKSLKKKNFRFLDSVPKNQILDYVYISDYSLVNLKKSEEFLNVIPSKIFENIALYKPILLGVEGESKELIESNEVGVSFEPENTESFLNAIDQIQNINIERFKKNCDKMIANFNRDEIAKNMIDFILKK